MQHTHPVHYGHIFAHCSMPSFCSHSHRLQLHHHLILSQMVSHITMFFISYHGSLPLRHIILNCFRIPPWVCVIMPVKYPSCRTCQMIAHPSCVHLMSHLIAFKTSEVFYIVRIMFFNHIIEKETNYLTSKLIHTNEGVYFHIHFFDCLKYFEFGTNIKQCGI